MTDKNNNQSNERKLLKEIQVELEKKEKLIEEVKKLKEEAEKLKGRLQEQEVKSNNEARTLQNQIIFFRNQAEAKDGEIEILVAQIEKRNAKLQELVNFLKSPPLFYGSFLRVNKDKTIDIVYRREVMRVLSYGIDVSKLKLGQKLLVSQIRGAIIVTGALLNDFQYDVGETVSLKLILDDNRIMVDTRDHPRIVRLAEPLLNIKEDLEIGDKLFLSDTGFAIARLPKSEVEAVELEEIPNVKYSDIGGLDEEIRRLRDEIEGPYIFPEEYKLHKVEMPKGAVLFGPPGNGKTMLGKALAYHMEREFAQKLGIEKRTSNFLLINGPELSSKWVGETERMIRELFDKAKKKYKDTGIPVVMFFDEADSFLPTRGSRKSSDAADDYVTQFCAGIDGVEELAGVIVVLATNRIDKIDPAVLRPGRISFKIRIGQPNEEGAREVLSKYLTPDLPLDPKYKGKKYKFKNESEIANYLIEKIIERTYSQKPEIQAKNRYVELTLRDGKDEILYFKDFVSCAALKNIVDRAKKKSIKNAVKGKGRGINLKILYESIEEEFQENEGLPSSREAIDEWLRMHGKRWEIIREPKFLKREVEETKEFGDRSPDIL